MCTETCTVVAKGFGFFPMLLRLIKTWHMDWPLFCILRILILQMYFLCSRCGPRHENLRTRYQRRVISTHLRELIISHLYHCTFLSCTEGNNTQPTRAPVINVRLAWVSVTRFHLLLWGQDEGADWGRQMDGCALSGLAQRNSQQGRDGNDTWSTWHWVPASSLSWEAKTEPPGRT